MSGYKRTYVSVEEQELRRLRNVEHRLQAYERNMPELVDAIQQANRREINRAFDSVMQRQQADQQAIHQRIQSLQSSNRELSEQQQEIRQRIGQVLTQVYESEQRTGQQIEQQRQDLLGEIDRTAGQLRQETNQLMSQQRRDLMNQIDQRTGQLRQEMDQQRTDLLGQIDRTAGRLRQETRQLLNEQNQRLSAAIEQERQARAQAINALHAAIDRERQERANQMRVIQDRVAILEQDKIMQREWALALIKEAEQERKLIESNHRAQQFAPGDLAKLEAMLQRARNDLQAAPQTALGHAEEAFAGMIELRRKLQELESAWDRARAQAIAGVDGILATAARNRRCQAIAYDEAGNLTTLDVLVEVDHWTQGKLTQLEREVGQVRDSLGSASPPFTTEDLKDVAESKVETWRIRVEELITEARLAVLGAERRNQVAEIAVEALVQQGFEFVGDAYEHSDDRETFQANVADSRGNQIVVRVSPVAERPLDGEVSVISYDRDERTPVELRARARDVTNVLRDNGVPVPDFDEVHNAQPNPAWADLKGVSTPVARTTSSQVNAPRGTASA